MFFREIDILSPKLTLFYFNQKSHSSIISGILTLIIYCMCVISIIYFSLDLILHKNETSYFYNRIIKDAGLFSMKDKLFHFIHLTNMTADLSVIQIIGLEKMLFGEYNEDGKRENFNHYIYSPCTKEMRKNLKEEISNIIEDPMYNNSYCIDSFYNSSSKIITKNKENNFTYPLISHGTNNPNVTYYSIIIQKCINSTLNNFSCDTPENIENKIFESGTNLNLINYEIDIKNYNNPIINYFIHIFQGFSILNTPINHLNLKPLIIKTNDGLIFNSKKKQKIFTFEQNEKHIWESKNGILGVYYFWLQNNALIYERRYKKIQNIIADFGGVTQGIYIITYFLNWIIYKFTLLNDINQLLCYFINLKEKKGIVYNFNHFNNSSSILNLNNININNDKVCHINNNIPCDKNIFNNQNVNKKNYEFKENKISNFSYVNFYSFFKWILCCCLFRNNNSNKISYVYNIYKKYISEESLFSIILQTKEIFETNI